jgi:pimeloyl-ACP methyl ester carboxylesterase
MTATGTPVVRPRPDNVLRLADGRLLGYGEYGDPNGTPVLAFHGFPGSRVFARISHEAAARAGVRVIAPERPGFGLSTYKPKRRIVDWPDDVAQLADALGIERFAVMGVSGGGPYAAACACKLPSRVRALAIVSGVGPMHRPGATKGMLATNRMLFSAQRRLPPLGRLIVWFMGQSITRGGERGVERFLKALPEPDQEIVRRPEMRELFVEDGREAFRSGARGPALECALLVHRWGFRLEEISVPCHLWQGEADRNVPASHGRYQAAVIPNCTAHFIAGAGHLLVVDRIEEIATAITS